MQEEIKFTEMAEGRIKKPADSEQRLNVGLKCKDEA
jgi:hypothetical protein